MNYYLGIDIGTSACKAIAFDEKGRMCSEAALEYDLLTPRPGWAELDPDEVMDKCFRVIRECAAKLSDCTSLGLGISSQGEAFVLLDVHGKTLCNAQVSSDTRALDMIKPFTESFGEDRLYSITGHTPHTMFSLYKLLWIQEHEAGLWKQTQRILCFEDLLQYRLGIAQPGMGWSMAGRTMLFDVLNHCWSQDILDYAQIPLSRLSRALPSGSLAGQIAPEKCTSLNLPQDAYVVCGGHDQTCAALGAGAIEPGMAVYATGSVECVTPAFEKAIFTPALQKNNFCTYDHAVEGLYATVAFSLSGGNLLKWFRDEFGFPEVAEAKRKGLSPYEVLMEKLPEDSSELMVLPYFTPSGTPYFDLEAKGAILGLNLQTSRLEILKALLEAVAMEIRLNLELLEESGYIVKELRAIGGGARSARHTRLKANIIGRPITVLENNEAGCMGVAMLAKKTQSGQSLKDICNDWVRIIDRVEPEKDASYEDKYMRYKALYPLIRKFYMQNLK